MKNSPLDLNTHLLVDGAMVDQITEIVPISPDTRPAWILSIYKDEIAQYSPLVLDVAAAEKAGALDSLMDVVNALRPQLHLSVIDTVLSAEELAQHLRHFIFVRVEGGTDLTLRFADCTVLPVLQKHFLPAQWSAFHRPVARWCAHDRDGQLTTLPPCQCDIEAVATPLVLSEMQVSAMKAEMTPDRVLANLKAMGASDAYIGSSTKEQHQWASEAYRLWGNAGQNRMRTLEALTAVALRTGGTLLRHRRLPALLSKKDCAEIEQGLIDIQTEIHQCEEKKMQKINL